MCNPKNVLLVLVVSVALGGPCVAAPIFSFNYLDSTGFVSASGSLITTALGGGQYQVTGITGTWNFYGVPSSITGLIAVGGFSNDNVLNYPTEPFVTYDGISFTVAGPGDDQNGDVNIYYSPSDGYSEADLTLTTFTVKLQDSGSGSSVPEPSTLLVVVLGFGGLLALKNKFPRIARAC